MNVSVIVVSSVATDCAGSDEHAVSDTANSEIPKRAMIFFILFLKIDYEGDFLSLEHIIIKHVPPSIGNPSHCREGNP